MNTQAQPVNPVHETQCDKLLRLLEWADGQWVTLPHILHLGIACHTRRIFELRQRGHIIAMRDEWTDGQRRTAYKLVRS